MSRKQSKPALLVRVLTEIGKGHISEKWITDKQVFVHGETVGRHITINPAVAVSETLIHEALHRLEPEWGENYVRRTTTFVLRRLSDEQIVALYEEYKNIVKRKKRTKVSGGTPSDGLCARPHLRQCRTCGQAPCRSAAESRQTPDAVRPPAQESTSSVRADAQSCPEYCRSDSPGTNAKD